MKRLGVEALACYGAVNKTLFTSGCLYASFLSRLLRMALNLQHRTHAAPISKVDTSITLKTFFAGEGRVSSPPPCRRRSRISTTSQRPCQQLDPRVPMVRSGPGVLLRASLVAGACRGAIGDRDHKGLVYCWFRLHGMATEIGVMLGGFSGPVTAGTQPPANTAKAKKQSPTPFTQPPEHAVWPGDGCSSLHRPAKTIHACSVAGAFD
jgi:hypothetical protein